VRFTARQAAQQTGDISCSELLCRSNPVCSWNWTLRLESRRNCRPDAFQTRQQMRCVTCPGLSTSEILGYNLSQTLARAVLCCSIPSLETFGRMAVLVLPPACSFPPTDDMRCTALCVTDRSLSFAAAVLSYVEKENLEIGVGEQQIVLSRM
jgi:hypothetical protein